MSIYDDLGPGPSREGVENDVPRDATEREPAVAEPEHPGDPPKKEKKRSGCLTCLTVCVVMFGVCMLSCGVGAWVCFKKAPRLLRNAIVTQIDQWDLTDDDRRILTEQVDRVVNEYQAGRVSGRQVAAIADHLAKSPFPSIMMAKAAGELYVAPSSLSDQEKAAAGVTLDRVAQGVFERRILRQDLEAALDRVSTVDDQGQRNFSTAVADDDLRALLADLKHLADDARVPVAPNRVSLGDELRQAVDQALANS